MKIQHMINLSKTILVTISKPENIECYQKINTAERYENFLNQSIFDEQWQIFWCHRKILHLKQYTYIYAWLSPLSIFSKSTKGWPSVPLSRSLWSPHSTEIAFHEVVSSIWRTKKQYSFMSGWSLVPQWCLLNIWSTNSEPFGREISVQNPRIVDRHFQPFVTWSISQWL